MQNKEEISDNPQFIIEEREQKDLKRGDSLAEKNGEERDSEESREVSGIEDEWE